MSSNMNISICRKGTPLKIWVDIDFLNILHKNIFQKTVIHLFFVMLTMKSL